MVKKKAKKNRNKTKKEATWFQEKEWIKESLKPCSGKETLNILQKIGFSSEIKGENN